MNINKIDKIMQLMKLPTNNNESQAFNINTLYWYINEEGDKLELCYIVEAQKHGNFVGWKYYKCENDEEVFPILFDNRLFNSAKVLNDKVLSIFDKYHNIDIINECKYRLIEINNIKWIHSNIACELSADKIINNIELYSNNHYVKKFQRVMLCDKNSCGLPNYYICCEAMDKDVMPQFNWDVRMNIQSIIDLQNEMTILYRNVNAEVDKKLANDKDIQL